MIEAEGEVEGRIAPPGGLGVEKDWAIRADEDVLGANVAVDERQAGGGGPLDQGRQFSGHRRLTPARRQEVGVEPQRTEDVVGGEFLGDIAAASGGGVDPAQTVADRRGHGGIDLAGKQLPLPQGKSVRRQEGHGEDAKILVGGQDLGRAAGDDGLRRLEPAPFIERAADGRAPVITHPQLGDRAFDDEDPSVGLHLPDVRGHPAREHGPPLRRAWSGEAGGDDEPREDRLGRGAVEVSRDGLLGELAKRDPIGAMAQRRAIGKELAVPAFRTLELADIRLRVAIEGEGPLVVLVHGFPESWFSWRHQLGPLAAAGFQAAAIDVRGYGGSGKPPQIADYAMERMVGDVTGVIDALSPNESAVVVGHDWGAPIAWNSALVRPDRVRAVAGLSVPYFGVPTRSTREVFEEAFTARGRFFYQAYFQAPGVAEAELEANPRDALRRFYYALSGEAPVGAWPLDKPVGAPLLRGLADPDPFPSWLSPDELDYFVGEFSASGFRGPLNRYRCHDRDFTWLQTFKGRHIAQPALFIGGEKDLVLSMLGRGEFADRMKSEVPDLRGADVLDGCGHWTQQERPEAVNERLLAWLGGL